MELRSSGKGYEKTPEVTISPPRSVCSGRGDAELSVMIACHDRDDVIFADFRRLLDGFASLRTYCRLSCRFDTIFKYLFDPATHSLSRTYSHRRRSFFMLFSTVFQFWATVFISLSINHTDSICCV